MFLSLSPSEPIPQRPHFCVIFDGPIPHREPDGRLTPTWIVYISDEADRVHSSVARFASYTLAAQHARALARRDSLHVFHYAKRS